MTSITNNINSICTQSRARIADLHLQVRNLSDPLLDTTILRCEMRETREDGARLYNPLPRRLRLQSRIRTP